MLELTSNTNVTSSETRSPNPVATPSGELSGQVMSIRSQGTTGCELGSALDIRENQTSGHSLEAITPVSVMADKYSKSTVFQLLNGTVAERHELRRIIKSSQEHIENLIKAVDEKSPIDMALAGQAIFDDFQGLWRLRHLKDRTWTMALNVIQNGISDLDFESIDASCAQLLQDVMTHFDNGSIDKEDLTRITSKLARAGLGPYGIWCESDPREQ